jgi:mono/diheme cytochrome c family protein
MKKLLKILAIVLFGLIFGAVVLLAYITKFKPNIPVEQVKIEYTPERIERGRYLAHNVAQCIDCHSTRDWSRFSGPIIPGTEGKGGEAFDQKIGFPGKYYAPNLTPHHLREWSDGELFRAITSGVSKDGRPLFPVMPYLSFGKMDREDIYSIIAYIRSLPGIENEPPKSESDFPMNVIIHTIPAKPEFTQKPSQIDKVKYGEYLTNAASCVECHTPVTRGQIVKEMEYAGGRFFPFPDGSHVISSNITPDKQTGIGNWDEETFVQRFKAFDKSVNNVNDAVKSGEFNTIMPWSKYAQMTNEDLAAIYAYLRTLKPISNKIGKTFIKNK